MLRMISLQEEQNQPATKIKVSLSCPQHSHVLETLGKPQLQIKGLQQVEAAAGVCPELTHGACHSSQTHTAAEHRQDSCWWET